MHNPIGWFEIYVENMERAVNFYERVFEVDLQDLSNPEEGQLTMKGFPSNMEQYGASGALVQAEGVQIGNNSTVVYFSCEDCSEEEQRVQQNGGEIERSKMSIGDYGFVTIAKDTEGNRIGLHSLK